MKSLKPDTVDWVARPPFVSQNLHSLTTAPYFKAVTEQQANHFLKLQGHWMNDVFIWQTQVAT